MKRTLNVLLTAALVLALAVTPAVAAGGSISLVGYIAPDAGYQPVNNSTDIENDRLLVRSSDTGGNTLYGYADSTGELVIPLQYRQASVFHEGAAVVALEDWSYALIDPDGNYIVEPKVYESIGAPVDGGGLFQVSGQGYMDSHGELVIPTTSYNATGFYCGCAYFQEEQTLYVVHWDEDSQSYVKEVQCQLPKDITISYGDIFTARGGTFSFAPMDYAVVRYTPGNVGHGYGVIDRSGKLVVPTDYEGIELYPNGVAVVTESYERNSTGVIRLSDGKKLLPCTHDRNNIEIGNEFIIERGFDKEGVAVTKNVYNLDGEIIFNEEYFIQKFTPGVLALFKNDDTVGTIYTYVDAQGNVIDTGDFTSVSFPFSDGLTTAEANDGSWIINEKFKKVAKLDNKIRLSGSFSRGYIFGTLRGDDNNRNTEARILMDAKGNIVWQTPFQTFESGSSWGFLPTGFDENGYAIVFDSRHGTHILRMVEPSLDNFIQVNTYTADTFRDVPEGQWYTGGIQTAYELGLMKGTSEDSFDLEGTVTVSSALAMAARIHSIYHTGAESFDQSQGRHWYDVYVNYCREQGIFTQTFDDYNRPATRAEFAAILAGALPAEALPAQREWADDSIPDVKMEDPYAAQIYTLYRAGVLTGNDAAGTFTPESQIGRSAAAAIVARMAKPDLRAQ